MLSAAYFHSEDAAYSFFEARLWPGGPVCPHCRSTGKKIGKLNGQTTRRGLYKCYGCRRPFTVKIGTIFESSHLKLHLWLQAIYLLSCNRRRITLRQLQQTLGIGLKTAWVLNRLIRDLIPRDSESAAVIGEHRSAVPGKTSATVVTMTVTAEGRTKAAAALRGADPSQRPKRPEAGASKPEPYREYRKPRARRRPHDPRQMRLF
jgi:transposase-like protein